MAQLNTVTFDLWQTLIIDFPALGRPRARRRLEGVMAALGDQGVDVAYDDLAEASRRCYQICDEIRGRERDVTFDEQIDIFVRSIDEGLPERITPETRTRIARRYADSYLEHPPIIADGARRVLHALKEMGYNLGLICNTGSTPGVTQRVFLERAGLARFFDTMTFSDEERLSKPSTEIFQRTLERLGATPDRTVHVGDHPVNDVEGAKRAGLRAIWVRREGKEVEVEPDAIIDSLEETLEALERLERASSPSPFLDTR